MVLEESGRVAGCIGLELYGDQALLRSLAVQKSHREKGNGSRLYEAIVEKAKKRQIQTMVLLTETAEAFFLKQGFRVISRDVVDAHVRSSVEFASCCPASAVCMIKQID